MPQLDPRYFTSQFFWIIVCFGLFYICMHFIIVPRLRSILTTRHQVNERNTTKARMLMQEIEELKIESHAKIVALHKKINEMQESSERKFQEYTKNTLDEFNKKIKSSYDETMLEIEKQKNILDEKATNAFVASLADKVIGKLTGDKL